MFIISYRASDGHLDHDITAEGAEAVGLMWWDLSARNLRGEVCQYWGDFGEFHSKKYAVHYVPTEMYHGLKSLLA